MVVVPSLLVSKRNFCKHYTRAHLLNSVRVNKPSCLFTPVKSEAHSKYELLSRCVTRLPSVQVCWSEQSIATGTLLWFLLHETKSRWNTIRAHSCEGKVKIFWVCLDKAAESSHAMCQPLINLPVCTSHRHIPSFPLHYRYEIHQLLSQHCACEERSVEPWRHLLYCDHIKGLF